MKLQTLKEITFGILWSTHVQLAKKKLLEIH